jgi:hypothetical protein
MGPVGPMGLTGPMGPVGPMGLTGPMGPAGRDGLNGSDGASATLQNFCADLNNSYWHVIVDGKVHIVGLHGSWWAITANSISIDHGEPIPFLWTYAGDQILKVEPCESCFYTNAVGILNPECTVLDLYVDGGKYLLLRTQ